MSDIKDLWELGKAQGAHDERERIIGSLEENWIEPMHWLTVKALIKGEQA